MIAQQGDTRVVKQTLYTTSRTEAIELQRFLSHNKAESIN